ncbi:MAG: DnaJ domain-containing protein [Rhodospirillaceae bacterium]|nr:DnaJ domain-containing protein [Rhodospirillaceae bacterium]
MRKVRLDNLRNYRGPADRPVGRRCDHVGCKKEGAHRAPKSRDRLKDYYYFCQEHAHAYNKAWNYHAGMSAEEIEAHLRAAVIGERPLWPLGVRGNQFWGHARRFRDPLGDGFGPFDGEEGEAPRPEMPLRPATLEDQALATLGLTGPADLATIKQHYKRLVKRYHPDANGGGDQAAEEQLKRINEAYAILKKRKAS